MLRNIFRLFFTFIFFSFGLVFSNDDKKLIQIFVIEVHKFKSTY